MKLFDCKVRIMGEVKDEVVRTNVTNAEIQILRSIHGDDGVVNIEPVAAEATTPYVDDEGLWKLRPRTEADERRRLEQFYGEITVSRLFGVARPSITDEPASLGDVVIPLEPPVRAEPKRPQPAKALQLEDVA